MIQSFTNDKSLVEILKEEMRYAIIREEDYKY
jgi:hypothetical protein